MTLTDRPADNAGLLIAVAILIAGLVFAAINGAVMKELAGALPALVILWGRFLALFVFTAPIAVYRYGLDAFRPPMPGLQLVRIALLMGSTICFISGVAEVPFSEAIAILYVYPFVLTALSPVLLGERVSPSIWAGVVGGFIGVLIVMRPDFSGDRIHALMVLAAGIMLGLHLVVTRKVVRAASPLITSTYTAFVVTAVSSLAVFMVWQPISAGQMVTFALLGVISAVSQWLILLAFSRAPAPVLAPYSYVEIPAAVVIGLIGFGELPDAVAWTGIAVIIASGLLVARAPRLGVLFARKRPPGP